MAHWHTLTRYTGPLVYTLGIYPVYTVSVHWLYTALSSVSPVYTLSNPVSSYTGATLAPLQCMHSVHCSVCPVYTLTDTGIGSGYPCRPKSSVASVSSPGGALNFIASIILITAILRLLAIFFI